MKKAHYYALLLLVLLASCNDKNSKAQSKIDWNLYKPVWQLPIMEAELAFHHQYIAAKDQYTIRFREGTSQAQIIALEGRLSAIFGTSFKVKSCKCDSLLRNYEGLDITEILKHDELAVRPNGNRSGDGTPIPLTNAQFMSPTYITQTDRESNVVNSFTPEDEFGVTSTNYKTPFHNFVDGYRTTSGTAFKIGVLDTGFDFDSRLSIGQAIFDQDIPIPGSRIRPCRKNNFYGEFRPQDDDPTRHGTLVTALLLNQLKGVPVKIYPVKVLDNNGKGNLFNFVCALASQDQMTAYNLSLGFYADTASFPKKLVSAYMKQTNSWFFVAAGNKVAALDSASADANRDLSVRKYKFYPACLTDVPKMVVVTTARRTLSIAQYSVCGNQNYSDQFVHVGVVPDFPYPFLHVGVDVGIVPYNSCLLGFRDAGGTGTSFATPIALGKALATWKVRSGVSFPRQPTSRDELFGSDRYNFTRTEPMIAPRQIKDNRLVEESLSFIVPRTSSPKKPLGKPKSQ
ncbi:MAG: hypothetical protein EAZ70_01105 [Runella slithyformis]|nr:MAG: hypothetical protein EAZ70_01105 [Runella slithyformis]TAF48536.1 MAG: hypothetical protein EAZ63_04490 [Runella slithyformis]TAF83334.1 MAG: hypothetical protein EAZ50_01545 [Runella slithyformis]